MQPVFEKGMYPGKSLKTSFFESWKTLEFGLHKSWKVLEKGTVMSAWTLKEVPVPVWTYSPPLPLPLPPIPLPFIPFFLPQTARGLRSSPPQRGLGPQPQTHVCDIFSAVNGFGGNKTVSMYGSQIISQKWWYGFKWTNMSWYAIPAHFEHCSRL